MPFAAVFLYDREVNLSAKTISRVLDIASMRCQSNKRYLQVERMTVEAMDIDKLIARINELSRKFKTVGLTDEETKEREQLRQQYLNNFKSNFKQQLDSIRYVEDEEGNEGQIKH